MKYENEYETKTTTVKIKIKPEHKNKAKSFAKMHGYSFQDWLGKLVVEELQKYGALEDKRENEN